jgi:hypothetical protein
MGWQVFRIRIRSIGRAITGVRSWSPVQIRIYAVSSGFDIPILRVAYNWFIDWEK